MKSSELYSSYLNSDKMAPTSKKVHKAKIQKYIEFLDDPAVQDLFQENYLRNYIFEGTQHPSGKYDALRSFYNYYFENILKVHRNEIPFFPVNKKDILPLKSSSRRRLPVYFPSAEHLSLLFLDTYYQHLNESNATLTIKAAFALSLFAGYDSGSIFHNNKNERIIEMKDVIIEEDYVKVRNFYTQSTVPWILIRGQYANYIKEYYKERVKVNVKKANQTNNFIAHIWDSTKLKYEEKVASQKPYTPYDLVSYMLKYIAEKEGYGSPVISDLRANMVFHALLNTKGSALKDIIEMYGYPPFVQQAFEQYCIANNRNSDEYFSPLSLDIKELRDEKMEVEEDWEAINNTREDTINRLIRDTTKVKVLKKKYDNICQICNEQITLIKEVKYSEVHHIQPFNMQHKGVDDFHNMIVLCPNHHKLFDLGIIALDPENHDRVLHLDEQNSLHNKLLLATKHKLSSTCVRYHYENIFLKLKETL
ncbi:HNH endonuclease [Priestia megaterium]